MIELDELDAIEESDPESSEDSGALPLMRRVADSAGVALLVHRYGASRSLNVVHWLAFLLAERAAAGEPVGEHIAVLARRFAGRPRHPEFAATLTTALQKEISVGTWSLWDEGSRAAIASFALECLSYGSDEPHAILIWEDALGLVSHMRSARILEAFGPELASELDGKARRLCAIESGRIDPLLCQDILGEE